MALAVVTGTYNSSKFIFPMNNVHIRTYVFPHKPITDIGLVTIFSMSFSVSDSFGTTKSIISTNLVDLSNPQAAIVNNLNADTTPSPTVTTNATTNATSNAMSFQQTLIQGTARDVSVYDVCLF